jgi:hypothetical protein
MKHLLLFFVITAVTAFGCKHQPETPQIVVDDSGGGNNNPHPCDPDTVYFTNDILPLLVSSCAMPNCHDAVTHAEGVRLYDYAHIIQQVEPGNPDGSDLYDELFDGMPPADAGGPLSATEKDMIRRWIEQGALNNGCIQDCDPNAAITFSAVVWPVVENNCTGCHSGNSPSAGISLTSYSSVYMQVLNGNLMNSLNGTNGVSLMPDNTSGLPACQIEQFQAWVDAGAPNN